MFFTIWAKVMHFVDYAKTKNLTLFINIKIARALFILTGANYIASNK